jgi:hypothetical protein
MAAQLPPARVTGSIARQPPALSSRDRGRLPQKRSEMQKLAGGQLQPLVRRHAVRPTASYGNAQVVTSKIPGDSADSVN